MAALHFHIVSGAEHREELETFEQLQAACYARYQVGLAARAPSFDDSVRYLIVTREGSMVAGIRIHTRRPDRPLPFEAYFAGNEQLAAELDWRMKDGIAELAGLWSSPEVARTGIGGFIVGAAAAAAPYLDLAHMVSFAHQFNRFTRQVGFEPDLSLGEHAFPDARYRSAVNWCETDSFKTADPEARTRILALRAGISQVLQGGKLPLGFHPPTRPIVSARPRMAILSHKTRAFQHLDHDERTLRVAPNVLLVESRRPPADVEELLLAWPSIMATLPANTPATTLAVRNDAGELLASVAVCRGVDSPLADYREQAALARCHYLGSLAWADGAAAYAPLALYLGVRRARIEGARAIATQVKDAAGALSETLGFRPLLDVPVSAGRTAQGQRIDLAAHRAFKAFDGLELGRVEPELFTAEVVETFERWLRDLYGRGFFKAVSDGSLSREQYVNTVSNMHQFVRWTTRLLGHAVAHSHDREVRNHFLSHLSGEINHELIIERDLEHLGEDVDFVVHQMAASPGTRQFMAVQESLIGLHHDPLQFLASPLAAEGVASHLTPDFLAAMEKNIASWGVADAKKAMVFFSSHVHTDGGDDGHWEHVLRVVTRHLKGDDDVRRFLGILHASMSALTAAYDEFVEDTALFAASDSGPISRAPDSGALAAE